MKMRRMDDWRIEIPREGKMRVPGVIFADKKIEDLLKHDESPAQVANVACLPGIVKAAMAMPDIHWGYGFPIGGVAAFDVENSGVVSPGGVGYDINCGVRLLRTSLEEKDVKPEADRLAATLFNTVPCGVGSCRKDLKLNNRGMDEVLSKGASALKKLGMADDSDLENIEDRGCIENNDPSKVSERAKERGSDQLGTLGSGNHFLEVGTVDEIYDERAASVMGLFKGTVTILIHSGSRGLGYQTCDDFLSVMQKASSKYSIELPDRQLCCAPVKSPEGDSYLKAMACAANFAFANRQALAHFCAEAFEKVFKKSAASLGIATVYDIAHNIAKLEDHKVNGDVKKLCVHRKGATRAFGPGRKEVPSHYREIGQPVIIPGDMGSFSYVLLGTKKAEQETFGSACHGAGRVLSRKAALKNARGRSIASELREKGIVVMSKGKKTLAEEMPDAYKDVHSVVDVVHGFGIAQKVARLRPILVIKG